MTFVQLQQLLEIHKTGSISQAAQNLFISQPSISLTLKSLEEELGFPIFLRTRKGLIPTLQGINVIDHAARICESYRLLTTPEPQKSTTLRISSVSFPPIHNSFLRLVEENRSRRDISFSLTQETGSADLLLNFTLEISFVLILDSRCLSFLDDIQKKGLHAKILATFPGAIRIGKGHPQFANPKATPADFENDILLDSRNATLSKGLLDAGITRIKPNYNIICVKPAVREALIARGLAYDITFFLPGDMDCKDFRYIPMEGVIYHLIALSNPLHPPVPELDRFMEILEQELAAAGLSEP